MPPAPSVTSTEQDEEVAFQVLNQDNLPIAIIGQPILKPFNLEAQKAKPNVVVHPTRRITTNKLEDTQKHFTKTSININNNQHNDTISRKYISSSHGNLCHNNSMDKMKNEDMTYQLEVERFSKILDSKLKRLQKDENKLQKKSNSDPPTCRKPFVTTVKKGQFLEPPPEIASLIGIKIEEQKYVKKNPKEVKKLYAFASHPRVLNRTPPRNIHQTRCEAATWAAAKLVGTVVGIRHEEFFSTRNLTYQPHHKKRSYLSTLNDQPKWNPNFAYAKLLSKDEVDSNIAITRIEQAQRRALARKRAKHQQIKRPKRGFAASDILRDRLVDISQLQRLLAVSEKYDAATQTEDTFLLENKEFNNYQNDVQIQVHPTDLFDFNTDVQPIVEILVSKTIEEALIEVLEEEELLAMKEQQRRFMEYMIQKTSDDSEMDSERIDDEETIRNMSKVIKSNYVPNLITSV